MMKSVIQSILPFSLAVLLTACGNSQSGNHDSHEGHNHGTEHQTTSHVPAAVTLKDGKLNAVYQHYIHLTTALTDGDTSEAKVAAAAIEAGAKEINNGGKLANAAAKITTAADIAVQRKEYAALSNDIISLVKQSGLNNGELYVAYCPMALDDQGASWLSNSKAIKNPYFGASMLTCGEVKESIN